MKKISVLVPCYNETGNITDMAEALENIFATEMSAYDYEILFIDNCSSDGTREKIEALCVRNPKIKAIFNARNFGWSNSSVYGLCQTTGDCTVMLCADFQEPPELIPQFVEAWEDGYKIVAAIKNQSEENPIMYLVRSLYYKTIKQLSEVEQIEHFTGFGLYDRSFIDVLRNLDDANPFLRGLVAELGYRRKDIYYKQKKRKTGTTHFSWFNLYDVAMRGFTSYTKAGLRAAIVVGFCISLLTLMIATIYLVMKLVWWDAFQMGMAPVVIGMFFLGSIQLFFLGLLGEYVLSINARIMKRPLVVEEKRINF